jgi:hypothetical protein
MYAKTFLRSSRRMPFSSAYMSHPREKSLGKNRHLQNLPPRRTNFSLSGTFTLCFAEMFVLSYFPQSEQARIFIYGKLAFQANNSSRRDRTMLTNFSASQTKPYCKRNYIRTPSGSLHSTKQSIETALISNTHNGVSGRPIRSYRKSSAAKSLQMHIKSKSVRARD